MIISSIVIIYAFKNINGIYCFTKVVFIFQIDLLLIMEMFLFVSFYVISQIKLYICLEFKVRERTDVKQLIS